MINVTFDTNCIIALEANEPEASDQRGIISTAPGSLTLRVVAISASDRKRDGTYAANFREFKNEIRDAGLGGTDILPAPCMADMSYVDHCILLSEDFVREAEKIHHILFATPFEYEDYCKATGADPKALDSKWRNRAVDTWAVWTHIHHGGGVFVTSDGNFHKPTKKAALAKLNARILRPREATTVLCSTNAVGLSSPAAGVSR